MKKPLPIACTLEPGAEAQQALAAYHILFADALERAERTDTGVRWTLRAEPGVEARVRSLAAMEERCCAFLTMDVSVARDVVVWNVTGPEEARDFLDQYLRLADRV